MRAAAAALAACALAVTLLGLALPASSEEEPGGPFIAWPLDVDILYPADGAAFRAADLTAVVESEGESVAFFSDDFARGTLVNVTRDASGIVPNASAGAGASTYLSPEFELPRVSPSIVWSGSLEFLTSGSGANLSELLAFRVRFGDLTAGRNWSAWFDTEVDGDYLAALGNASGALRSMGSLQYEVEFLQPGNASNPHISQMQLWFIGRIERIEARLAGSPTWTLLATSEGRYNLSLSLPEGASTIEARVTDALGGTALASVNVFRDNSPPAVALAPQDGASIPPDASAEVRFDGPMDVASALGVVTVRADFPVDMVWTADNTTLLLSAQESGRRGLVTLTIGPGLKDKAGNEFGRTATYTYEMGKPAEAGGSSPALLVALAGVVGIAAIAVLFMMGRAKRERARHAAAVRAEMESGPQPRDPR
jgi:hypothetical protein